MAPEATPPSATPASTSADPAAADPPAPDPEAAAREAARAVKPEAADGYALNFSEAALKVLGELKDDPAVAAIRNTAHAKGWTQGEFDDRIGAAVDVLAEAGLLLPNFNPAAELVKLGDNGEARRQEAEVFAKSLLDRGDITAEEHAELMSLAPVAAGVTLLEKMRRMMGPAGVISAPAEAVDAGTLKAKAAEMRRDPRYETDARFRNEADRLAMQSYGKK